MYLVFDIGGSSVKYALINKSGEIKEKGKIKTINYVENALPKFVDSLGEIYDEKKKKDNIEGIALSLPGQIDVKKGIVYGGGALSYLHEVKLGELISRRCDNKNVSLENDGKCAALAEVWLGNAKGKKDVCVLIFGTGIGGGIIIDGKIHRGNNFLAGEISYCFDKLTYEDIDKLGIANNMKVDEAIRAYPYQWSTNNATRAIVVHVADKKGIPADEVTGELIYKWIEEKDEEVIDIVERAYFDIAQYCVNLYLVVNPEVILIGGGISGESRFVDGIKRYVEKIRKSCFIYENIKIDVCKHKNDSNLYGALYNYMQLY